MDWYEILRVRREDIYNIHYYSVNTYHMCFAHKGPIGRLATLIWWGVQRRARIIRVDLENLCVGIRAAFRLRR